MSANLDIELLQTLVAIVDTGSFSAAARTVHRTQSAVSMQMKRLEEIVGQPLFEKHGRRTLANVHGQNLLPHARRILKAQDEAIAAFRQPGIRGEVRVGICDDYVMGFMPSILAEYAKCHPDVHLRLDSQPSKRLVTATLEGELDFALVNVLHDDLAHEQLTSERLAWVSSRKAFVHERRPLPLAIENDCAWGHWARQALDKAGIDYRVAYSTFNLSGIVAIVDAGLAVSVMSPNAVPASLRILGQDAGMPELPSSAIGLVLGGSALSPAAQTLADAIRRKFASASIAA